VHLSEIMYKRVHVTVLPMMLLAYSSQMMIEFMQNQKRVKEHAMLKSELFNYSQ